MAIDRIHYVRYRKHREWGSRAYCNGTVMLRRHDCLYQFVRGSCQNEQDDEDGAMYHIPSCPIMLMPQCRLWYAGIMKSVTLGALSLATAHLTAQQQCATAHLHF